MDKIHDVEYNESNTKGIEFTCENGEAKVMLNGSSRSISMYSQKGTKGVNQDAMTVWEVRNKILQNLYSSLFSCFNRN